MSVIQLDLHYRMLLTIKYVHVIITYHFFPLGCHIRPLTTSPELDLNASYPHCFQEYKRGASIVQEFGGLEAL